MKKMCRVMGLVLAFVMLLTVAGCGSKNDVVSDEETIKTPEQKTEENFLIDGETISLVQFDDNVDGTEVVVIETNLGSMTIEVYPKYAPKAVENFLTLAKAGFYNGLKFQRVRSDYFIQVGNPNNTPDGGKSIFEDKDGNQLGYENECSLDLWHFKGALGMVNGDDGLNRSQFYIIQSSEVDAQILRKMQDAGFPEKVVEKYKEVGGAPWRDGNNTIFGQVTKGLDVLDSIAAVAVDENWKPTEETVITKITVTSK